MLNQFFLFRDGAPTLLLLSGSYQPWLVALSVLVAALTSALALQMAGMAGRAENRGDRHLILGSGALAMGGGIWSMHFIGMLAFRLCTAVNYDTTITIVSLVPAVLASWVALALLSRGTMSRWLWVLGGVLVGAGIGTMHYAGMAAMQMGPQLRYDPAWFAASIVVAVLLAMVALWIRFGLEGRLSRFSAIALGGLVMGFAIAGMHYTAMGAARFVGEADPDCIHGINRSDYLALGITLVTLAVSALTAGANGLLGYRRLNLQLRAEKGRMQALVDTAPDGVITIDARGFIQSFNYAAERLFGWPATVVLGRNVDQLMPEASRGLLDDCLRDLQAPGRASVFGVGRDVIGQHREGHPLPIRLAIGRVEQPGAPLFVAFVSDISQRQQMEQALRESEEQYRSLIANSPGVNYRACADGNWSVRLISDSVLELTGWPAEDFLKGRQTLAGLMHPDDLKRAVGLLTEGMRENRPSTVEYRLHHRDGSERWVSATSRGLKGEDGSLQWVDGVILDITEAKRMQLALEEAKERAVLAAASKTAFLANMSHEIRTPMNAILGFTELLLDTTLSDAQRKHLNTVRGSARSLLGLLNDILDTAKLDKGAVELERQDFSLRAVCAQTLASLGLGAQRKGLNLQLDYPPDEAQFFQGDALRVQQVLVNLVGNAIKFTERGTVTLRMRVEEEKVHMQVIDTGIGIPPDRLERIFDAFAQADASTTRRFGGTGLGTTISRQLVEQMGGKITVESVMGQGSCFHIWLPLPLGSPVADDAEVADAAPGLPPLRLLVADDVAQNGELMQLMLGRDGHTVHLVTDGLQALQAITERDFDAVLMDVHMPELDGLGATRRIRRFELANHKQRTPVIALTASVLEEDRQAALAAGMDGFATKPVEPARLRAELARVLGYTPARAALPQQAGHAVEPDAEVLDARQGLRLWGSAAAWQRALRRFAIEQQDGPARLRALLHAKEWLEARALVHRWRGVAGSLALPHLLAAAGPLEEALRSGDDAVHLGEALAGALQDVLDACAELAAGMTSPAPLSGFGDLSGETASPDVAAPLLARMERTLQQGELDDIALRALVQALGAARCAPLTDALDQFDFEAALRAVQALRQN